MSESWQPEESGIWQTRPSESSHPSFPFNDRGVDPFGQSLAASHPIPPPPPPPISDAYHNDRQTAPIIGTAFGMGIGVIIGAIVTFVVLLALGYLLLNKGLGLGNHPQPSTAISASPATGGGTQGGGSGGSQGGSGGSQGGAGSSSPGVTANNGATPQAGTTPFTTGTPDSSITATTVASTGTTMSPTATSTPAPLPLAVTAAAQDHKLISITVQTKDSASLAINVIFCDGSTRSLNGTAAAGIYNTAITSGIPKCSGNSPDTITVTGHLAGYNDATVTITTTQTG